MARPFSQDWESSRMMAHGTTAAASAPYSAAAAHQNHHGMNGSASQFPGQRPASEGTGTPRYTSKEAEAIDAWFDDLNNYERTLEQMNEMTYVDSFKEEMQAVMAWFLQGNEAERTTIMYALLKQCSQLQIRFFLMVLQQMARKDPIANLLSPRVSLHEMEKNNPELLGKVTVNEQNASRRLLEVLPGLRSEDLLPDDHSRLYNRHSFPERLRRNDFEHSFSGAFAAETRKSAPPTTHYVLSNHTIPTEPLKPARLAPPVPGAPQKRSSLTSPGSNSAATMQGAQAQADSAPPLPARPSYPPPSSAAQTHTLMASKPAPALPSHPNPHVANNNSFTAPAPQLASPSPSPQLNNSGSSDSLSSKVINVFKRVSRGQEDGSSQPQSPSNPLPPALASPSPQPAAAAPATIPPKPAGLGKPIPPVPTSTPPQESREEAHSHVIFPRPAPRPGAEPVITPHHISLPSKPRAVPAPPAAHHTAPASGLAFAPPKGDNESPPPMDHGLPAGQELDIPTWLKALRLHKYTPIFETMSWEKMVSLTDDDLQELGITALGARRKILKEFETLKQTGYPPKA